MADNENMVYEIHFNTGEIEDSLGDLAGGLGALETASPHPSRLAPCLLQRRRHGAGRMGGGVGVGASTTRR